MNPHEKEVMRRKRPIMSDMLDFSVQSQKLYRKLGLLNDKMLPDVLSEQTDYGRTYKWLELVSKQITGSFEKLQELMIEQNESWVADELYADFIAESGELEIEEYVYREAGMLVHKHYGRTTRVSETDKKDIQSFLALRYQAAKEAWRRQLEKERGERDEAMLRLQRENERLKGLAEKIKAFMRVQKPVISKYAHDMENAMELCRDDPDPDASEKDYYDLTENAVDETLNVLASTLFERELKDEERKRCLDILGMSHKPDAKLDIVIEEALQHAADGVTKAKQEAEMSDRMAKAIEDRLKLAKKEFDRDMSEKERQCLHLEQVIRGRDERLRELEQSLLELQDKMAGVEYDEESWRKRCELIEKTRRLGYYYPGWYDKMYFNIDSVEYDRAKKSLDGTTSGRSTATMNATPSPRKPPLIRKTTLQMLKDGSPRPGGTNTPLKRGKNTNNKLGTISPSRETPNGVIITHESAINTG